MRNPPSVHIRLAERVFDMRVEPGRDQDKLRLATARSRGKKRAPRRPRASRAPPLPGASGKGSSRCPIRRVSLAAPAAGVKAASGGWRRNSRARLVPQHILRAVAVMDVEIDDSDTAEAPHLQRMAGGDGNGRETGRTPSRASSRHGGRGAASRRRRCSRARPTPRRRRRCSRPRLSAPPPTSRGWPMCRGRARSAPSGVSGTGRCRYGFAGAPAGARRPRPSAQGSGRACRTRASTKALVIPSSRSTRSGWPAGVT